MDEAIKRLKEVLESFIVHSDARGTKAKHIQDGMIRGMEIAIEQLELLRDCRH